MDGARIYAENAIRQKNQVGKDYMKDLKRTELDNININLDSICYYLVSEKKDASQRLCLNREKQMNL